MRLIANRHEHAQHRGRTGGRYLELPTLTTEQSTCTLDDLPSARIQLRCKPR
jgi:hypothetical protein